MGIKVAAFLFFAILTKLASGITSELPMFGSGVEIRDGDKTCISDCSQIPAEGNKPLVCSVEDCTVSEVAGSSSPKSEVKKENVYFEVYLDDVDELKLSLHFEWSPLGNNSTEKTKGYFINITDGNISYSICYSLSSPMDIFANPKALFYNDCFGKVKGTTIKLGSIITVSIATLPLSEHGHDDGKVMFKVEVPNCNRKELRGFTECIQSDEYPTRLPCKTDCNTYSNVKGVTHPVSCHISKSENLIFGKEKCVKVDKALNGNPSQPKRLNKTQEWYKYFTLNGGVKLALNFSWTPRRDSSLEHLHGYYLEIHPVSRSDISYYNKCFSVHTNLTFLQHSETEFFHDCYGRGINTVIPGDKYLIHLNSLPENDGAGRETFFITVPDCEDPRMEDVTYCILKEQNVLKGTVDGVFCHNRSVKYTYHVSQDYGSTADILLCKYGGSLSTACAGGGALQRMRNIAPNNTLYNISLLSSADLSINYSIIVHGSKSFHRSVDIADFSKCLKKSQVSQSSLLVLLIVAIVILSVIIVVILSVWCMCNRDCWSGFLDKSRRGQNVTVNAENGVNGVGPRFDHEGDMEMVPQPAKIQVYVVFMQDHEYHTEVVHHFCCYLKKDLGMDVKLSIWQTQEVATNSLSYMDDNLRNADKVIVICSVGTKNCLDKEEYDGDLFTPVVKNICQSFFGRNPGKFLIGYFDYSNQSHIPEVLNEQCKMYRSSFKLMKQFEQMYFHLVGVEQYQEKGIQRIEKIAFDRYYDPSLTKYGKQLKEAVDKMKLFVEANPTWYNDLHGSDQPQPDAISHPTTSKQQVGSDHIRNEIILDPSHPEGGITSMNPKPPPDLHGEIATATTVLNEDNKPRQMRPERSGLSLQSSQSSRNYPSMSTDSSYFIDEDLSPTSPGVDGSAQNFFQSYHPDSFQEYDFSPTDDQGTGCRLLSDETEITRIGLTPSMEKITQRNGMMFPFLSIEEGEVYGTPAAGHSPESGVFTLAPVENSDDVEDHIKKINKA